MQAHTAGQPLGGAAAGHQAKVHVLVSDAGVFGHQRHIAGHHQFESARQGKTVHHRDDRDGQFLDPAQCVGDLGHVIRQQGGILKGGLEVGEVGAGAKGPAFAPDHQHLDGLVVARLGHPR